MTRKDYEAFAREIQHRIQAGIISKETATAMVNCCCSVFQQDNSNFKRQLFEKKALGE